MKIRSLLVIASTCVRHLVFANAFQPDSQQVLSDASDVFRIAIVGAGPAGSSAAYHLSRFLNETSQPLPRIEISIFDPADHPGGRSTTVNAFNLSSEPVELGASIFVKINHILYNATKEFGLVTNDAYHDAPRDRAGYGLGVWTARSSYSSKLVTTMMVMAGLTGEDGGTLHDCYGAMEWHPSELSPPRRLLLDDSCDSTTSQSFHSKASRKLSNRHISSNIWHPPELLYLMRLESARISNVILFKQALESTMHRIWCRSTVWKLWSVWPSREQ